MTDGRADIFYVMPHTIKISPAHRWTCFFTGRVQGVGFRYTTQNIAMQHDVTGYVRNLPDRRVELIMEGHDGDMDQIVRELRRRMEGCIRECCLTQSPATGEFERFSIKH